MIAEFPLYQRSVIPTVVRRSKTVSSARFKHKTRTKISLPILNIVNTWRGASEIVAKYNYYADFSVSFTEIKKSANDTFCACVSYKVDSNTIIRYKLWENIGEILYVPLYTGQSLGRNFFIEIWNTNTANIIGGGDSIYLSKYIPPTCTCDSSDISLDLGLKNCHDVTLNLANFDWSYQVFVLVGDCGDVAITTVPVYDLITLLCPDDDTYHVFGLSKQPDGMGGYLIQPSVSQEPEPNIRIDVLLFNSAYNQFKLGISLAFGNYTFYIDGPYMLNNLTGSRAFVLRADDHNYYVVSLDPNTNQLSVEQNPVTL